MDSFHTNTTHLYVAPGPPLLWPVVLAFAWPQDDFTFAVLFATASESKLFQFSSGNFSQGVAFLQFGPALLALGRVRPLFLTPAAIFSSVLLMQLFGLVNIRFCLAGRIVLLIAADVLDELVDVVDYVASMTGNLPTSKIISIQLLTLTKVRHMNCT